jgi:hypothetical protein
MPAFNIPREQWAEFLATFSRQHRAWLTTIDPPFSVPTLGHFVP